LEALAEIKGKVHYRHLSYIQEKSELVRFDEINAAGRYKAFVSSYLDKLILDADTPASEDVWEATLQDVTDIQGSFTFDELIACCPENEDMAQKFTAAAKIFYCRSGAENVDGDFEVPETVWRQLGASNFSPVEANVRPNLLSFSHGRVLKHFAIFNGSAVQITR